MSRDMRDPQKLGEKIKSEVETIRNSFGMVRISAYCEHQIEHLDVPVVAEADGTYVGPLQRYPRA